MAAVCKNGRYLYPEILSGNFDSNFVPVPPFPLVSIITLHALYQYLFVFLLLSTPENASMLSAQNEKVVTTNHMAIVILYKDYNCINDIRTYAYLAYLECHCP